MTQNDKKQTQKTQNQYKIISLQCRIVKLKDMNNRLHTYFDRTRLERIDYFRQLMSAHYPAAGNAFG